MLNKNKEIAVRLKRFAKDKNYSLAELGRLLNMKQQAFKNYYDGISIPGGKILSKLAELGCDINWLLCGATFSVGKQINEPTESYKMNYSDLLLENKTMKEEINEFKIRHFDFERMIEKLQSRVKDLESSNETLQKELESYLERGSAKQTN
jgi:transcriptional regulator with XRE-family HTH domain